MSFSVAMTQSDVSIAKRLRSSRGETSNTRRNSGVQPNEEAISQTSIHARLEAVASKKRAKMTAKYFRVEEYGKGDILMGVTVPDIRAISKAVGNFSYPLLKELIKSKFHEERLLAVINLVNQYKAVDSETTQGALAQKKEIFEFYLNEMRDGIDNWDLTDCSASQIAGSYLYVNPDLKEKWLYQILAPSTCLWDRRIAMVATQYFIARRAFTDTIQLAELFIKDREDLMHKATGWMLREMGKQSKQTLVEFLNKHAAHMPRVMLRYSIEKLSEQERKKYLKRQST